MAHVELALRAMAGMQLICLALVVLLRSARERTRRAAALLPLGLAAYVVTSAAGADALPGWLIQPLTLMCVANPVWFWLLGEALFADDLRIEWRWSLLALLTVAAGAWHELGSPGPEATLAGIVFRLAALAVIGATVRRVLRGKDDDLMEPRRRWRSWFVVAVGGYGVLALAMLVRHGGQLPPGLALAHIAWVLLCSVAITLWLATHADPAVPVHRNDSFKGAAREVPRIDAGLVARIGEAMQVQHLYRQESLTVAELARALGSQEYLVRRAINGHLGHRNFNEFLHGYRLCEAAARLTSQPKLPILSIALDVGYGSIGPFNRAFRARFGMTPSEYRAARCAQPPVWPMPLKAGPDDA